MDRTASNTPFYVLRLATESRNLRRAAATFAEAAHTASRSAAGVPLPTSQCRRNTGMAAASKEVKNVHMALFLC